MAAHPPSASAVPTSPGAPTGLVSYPHDVTSFTEGLVYDRGVLFESTGLYGESKLRKIDLASGKVLAQVRLTPGTSFRRGACPATRRAVPAHVHRGSLLRVRRGDAAEEARAALRRRRLGSYDRWHALRHERWLVGPNVPRRHHVCAGAAGHCRRGRRGRWRTSTSSSGWMASSWPTSGGTNVLVRTDPDSGRIVQKVDLFYLPEPRRGATEDDVLNGIAYDAVGAGSSSPARGGRTSSRFVVPWGAADSRR